MTKTFNPPQAGRNAYLVGIVFVNFEFNYYLIAYQVGNSIKMSAILFKCLPGRHLQTCIIDVIKPTREQMYSQYVWILRL